MAEDLTRYYADLGVKTCYLHSDVDTLERVKIIRELRQGVYDVLIGINLLREGLDIPEVALVAVLDADKEGFLRSETSLIQTSGRAARNVEGRVILYADRVTGSMERAAGECSRRRERQLAYNVERGITPESVKKKIDDVLSSVYEADYVTVPLAAEEEGAYRAPADVDREVEELRKRMLEAAAGLEFEEAARCRDEIRKLQELAMRLFPDADFTLDEGPAPAAKRPAPKTGRRRKR
ncbi:MAG: excinuclease ABC subunit B, partial [Deltaproteobacteria bacterium]|nr:excinuclease ABC subunit B [Deltaproteobacteria bacterium]